MKTVNVEISDVEFKELGLQKNTMSFSELIEIIGRRISKQALERSIELSEKYGLSNMTMDDINEEIKAVRDAKADS